MPELELAGTKLGRDSAGRCIRLVLLVSLAPAKAAIQAPPVDFWEALALDLVQRRLEVAQPMRWLPALSASATCEQPNRIVRRALSSAHPGHAQVGRQGLVGGAESRLRAGRFQKRTTSPEHDAGRGGRRIGRLKPYRSGPPCLGTAGIILGVRRPWQTEPAQHGLAHQSRGDAVGGRKSSCLQVAFAILPVSQSPPRPRQASRADPLGSLSRSSALPAATQSRPGPA